MFWLKENQIENWNRNQSHYPTFAFQYNVLETKYWKVTFLLDVINMEARVPRHVLRGISFNSYNSSEILELSVKEITNPQTFDGLLHPTLGGLYDPKLGKVLIMTDF